MKPVMIIAAAALVATACTTGPRDIEAKRVKAEPTAPATPGPTAEPRKVRAASAARLERFDGCTTLLEHVKAEALKVVGPWGLPGAMFAVDGVATGAAEAATADSAAKASAPAGGTDYSTTNVQVEGVDEPDIVKTDGRRIFALGAGKLHSLTVRDGVAEAAGSLDIEGGWATELLLAGDRVLVLTGISGYALPTPMSDAISMPVREAPRSNVVVVDVSEPANMKVVSTISLEGSYVSARLADGLARIVVRSGSSRIPFETPRGGSEAETKRLLERNRDLVRGSKIDDWLPTSVVRRGSEVTSVAQATCGTTYRPAGFSGLGMTSVVTIDPADPSPRPGTSVLAEAETVYASAERLYVATNRWDVSTTSLAPEVAPSQTTTEVHRFDTSDRASARYEASGRVPGRLLNQFSLDEHGGYLRVATTMDATQGRESSSTVYVLASQQGALVEVGSVGGLGRDERIYAVRFMGDTGYVVTFRQIDPLYVLDLRNPLRPRVVGELKIPGYSAYLHPVGEGRLLGIGQNATSEGRVTGTQVSLFDVSDPADPKRLRTFELSGGHSEAEFDHHAFLWWAQRKLAVLPVSVYAEQDEPFVGAIALNVDAARGIAEVGRLSHSDHAEAPDGEQEPESDRAYVPHLPIRRAIVVGDSLFTVSEGGVLSSNLETLAERGWVSFR